MSHMVKMYAEDLAFHTAQHLTEFLLLPAHLSYCDMLQLKYTELSKCMVII